NYSTNALGTAVSDASKGQKVATAPANFYAAAEPAVSGICITNVGVGNVTYTIYPYTDTVGGAWPISTSNGTWGASLATGTVAPGATFNYNAGGRNFYKINISTGTAQVQMGGKMTYKSNGGDGDSFEGINNSGADWLASGGTQAAGRDSKFYMTQNFSDSGRIDIIAPKAGTILSRGLGTAGAWTVPATDPNPWPASTGGVDRGYQAYPTGLGTYWVGSQDAAHPIYVLYQSYMINAASKAFACIPLIRDVVFTPTNTPSPTPSRTPTPSYSMTLTWSATPSNSPSNTPSPSPSATLTSSPTPTATPTYTPSPTFTSSQTPSGTPTATPTYTPSPTYTSSPTPS
ncbi:MAG: hypothetical protein V4498_05405, partial [candidate division FCPU426 bacterium]